MNEWIMLALGAVAGGLIGFAITRHYWLKDKKRWQGDIWAEWVATMDRLRKHLFKPGANGASLREEYEVGLVDRWRAASEDKLGFDLLETLQGALDGFDIFARKANMEPSAENVARATEAHKQCEPARQEFYNYAVEKLHESYSASRK